MKFLKNILFKFLYLFLIVIIIISCNQKKEEKIKVKNKTDNNEKNNLVTIEKFSFTDSEKGIIKWTLNSNRAIINNSKKTVDLEDVNIVYKNDYTISSKKGKYLMDLKIAELYDTVKITNDNMSFLTENLKFYSNQNKIETNQGVKIYGENFYLSANKMIGFINKNKFILLGNVKSIIK